VHYKEYRGSTPKYVATVKDENGNTYNPLTAFTKVVIKIYGLYSGTSLINYSSESPAPEGYYSCELTSTKIKWAIPSIVTRYARFSENKIEIWVYYTDPDISPDGTGIECFSGLLNEFIDSEPEPTTTAAPTTTAIPTTTEITTIQDIDGNVYDVITVAGLKWIKQNWKENVIGSKVYDDDENNQDIYGRLYTKAMLDWITLPDGWRFPTMDDFETLRQASANVEDYTETGYWDTDVIASPNNSLGLSFRGAGYHAGGYYNLNRILALHSSDSETPNGLYIMSIDGDVEVRVGVSVIFIAFASVRLCRDI
jgi:uncharacterized protein (TIGR02145 family)